MLSAPLPSWPASSLSRFGLVRQPEAGQRHAGEADAEFLQRRAARDRLGQVLGEFIELIVHTFRLELVRLQKSECSARQITPS
jgi:hypothetical protein